MEQRGERKARCNARTYQLDWTLLQRNAQLTALSQRRFVLQEWHSLHAITIERRDILQRIGHDAMFTNIIYRMACDVRVFIRNYAS